MLTTPIVLVRDSAQYCRNSEHVLRGTLNTKSIQFWVDGDSEGAVIQIFAAYSDTSTDWYHVRDLPPIQRTRPSLYVADIPCCSKVQIRVASTRVHAFTLRINEVKL
jgi:hypothetical protein